MISQQVGGGTLYLGAKGKRDPVGLEFWENKLGGLSTKEMGTDTEQKAPLQCLGTGSQAVTVSNRCPPSQGALRSRYVPGAAGQVQ